MAAAMPMTPKECYSWCLAAEWVSCLRQAGSAVTSEPEVRQVTLPLNGARIVIASDGLWDAVNPKTAMHHIRSMPASKAATDLVTLLCSSNIVDQMCLEELQPCCFVGVVFDSPTLLDALSQLLEGLLWPCCTAEHSQSGSIRTQHLFCCISRV